jgi:hypothetical protein
MAAMAVVKSAIREFPRNAWKPFLIRPGASVVLCSKKKEPNVDPRLACTRTSLTDIAPSSTLISMHWVQWLSMKKPGKVQIIGYFRQNPGVKRFKLHNFRGTAMSQARMAGVSFDDAAVAFGCNPETMRRHYIALDEVAITDRVMERIQSQT